MTFDREAIKDLVVCSYYGTSPDPTKFSANDVHEALNAEIHKIANDYNSYRRNKIELFEIMQEAYTEILPKQVEAFMGSFAEIKTVPNKQKAQFIVKRGRRRAKQFVTAVALSGVYESFRLDKDVFELGGRAIGGAAYIDFERYICGDEDIAESSDILLEGIQEAIYGEVQKALLKAVTMDEMPEKNKVVANGFDAKAMRDLCAVAGTYGNGGAIIYATPEFVAAMGPEAIGLPMFVAGAAGSKTWSSNPAGYTGTGMATPIYNPRNIEEISQYGRIKTFNGNPIIEIPQSFTDETNEVTVANPSTAYIFPAGQTKPVKIVFEGSTQVDEFKGRDRSFEVEAYTKVGVGIVTYYNWCTYVNTELLSVETKYASPVNA